MKNQLQIISGQYSSKGVKEVNQDFHAISTPNDYLLKYKGIAVALADGISSSDVSDIASKISINSFIEDYYCTSQTWSVKKSAHRVLTATNSWLYSQTKQSIHRYNKDKGYVCTFSSIILKSTKAHIFHIGDSRVYKIRDNNIQQLTSDHRLYISKEENYLSRAMGLDSILSVDYDCTDLEKEDIFVLATDGVYEHINLEEIIKLLDSYKDDYDGLCKDIVEKSIENGSKDNLTIQIIKVINLPNKEIKDINSQLELKPLPPILEAREKFDEYTIIRNISSSPRSHVYLAIDDETQKEVIIKIPSTELKDDKAYLERFMLEDWIAKKINNAYVVKSYHQNRRQNYLYNVTEYIKGQTLSQWIVDNPKPKLQKVRDIVEQIAKGLYTFHRLEMIHQDLRPQNILIDETDSIKIIDFGSSKVEGIQDINTHLVQEELQGTALYSAPEYFWGDRGSNRSDIFSLAVITYQMISGKFPYDTKIARCSTKSDMKKLKYNPLYFDKDDSLVPLWVDEALKKALEIDPINRYGELSEFIYDLFNPNEDFLKRNRPPLMKRNPLVFWQTLTLIELSIILILMLD